jgi:dTDP-4-amino-4,6-dideoxygalactose transaminase
MKVPFLDLELQYYSIRESIDNAIAKAIKGFNYIRGKEVTEFEEAFGKALGTTNVVATGNGTDSLFVALRTLGIRAGDEVITPAFSCIPSAETVSLCHAQPVFADIDPNTYTLDPREIEPKITPKTKAVIAVHLFGQMAHIAEIKTLCQNHNLALFEDCAQAHLTEENGKYAGTFGDAGAFSFYPTKNLGAFGDAGCLITGNTDLATKMRRFANHGALEKDDHLTEGTNSRMDTIQAAILLAKLPFLSSWNAKRRTNAAHYNDLLREIDEISTPFVRPGTLHAFHIYAIRARNRNALRAFLRDKGIQTIVHYPAALPNLPAYQRLGHHPRDFPEASRLQDDILSLPVYPELTEQQIGYVCRSIRDFYAHN